MIFQEGGGTGGLITGGRSPLSKRSRHCDEQKCSETPVQVGIKRREPITIDEGPSIASATGGNR